MRFIRRTNLICPETEPEEIAFRSVIHVAQDKKSNRKAYELLGIDVSKQKASKLLGDSLAAEWSLDTVQQRVYTNSMRRMMKSNPGLNRKALSILGFERSELDQFDRIKSQSTLSLI